MSPPRDGLRRRLWRVYLLHAGLISLVALLSVLAAGYILQSFMIERALRDEADHFWRRHGNDSTFPPPATSNLTGYLITDRQSAALPSYLRDLKPGFHSLALSSGDRVVYLSQQGSRRLYLVFDSERVTDLALYFGLLPLGVILIVIYLAAWFSYRLSQRVISPIIWLAREVNQLDPHAPDSRALAPERLPGDVDEELRILANAIDGFARRINAFVVREREFTRDASHELRSPLAVIRMATGLLLDDPNLNPEARKSVLRIQRCGREMEELVEMFLMLAREADEGLPRQEVCLNAIVEEQLQRARLLAGDKPIEVALRSRARLRVTGPEKVLSVLVGNVLRNAFLYTERGGVTVEIDPAERGGQLVIADSGIGIPEEQIGRIFSPYVRVRPGFRGGYGVGLTIVRRLSERFQWPVGVESRAGAGTTVTLAFPDATVEPPD